MGRKIYQVIASKLAAIENCTKSGNKEWKEKHSDILEDILKNGPSGSGIDNGTKLDSTSNPEKLVFKVGFHHMNDTGYYDGWTHHTIVVRPSLVHGFTLYISGRDRNYIKEYLT